MASVNERVSNASISELILSSLTDPDSLLRLPALKAPNGAPAGMGMHDTDGLMIAALYISYLGRIPEPEGYMFWKNVVKENPSSIEELSKHFYHSREFQERLEKFGIDGILDTVYGFAFNRRVEPEGLAYWKQFAQEKGVDKMMIDIVGVAFAGGYDTVDGRTILNKAAVARAFVENIDHPTREIPVTADIVRWVSDLIIPRIGEDPRPAYAAVANVQGWLDFAIRGEPKPISPNDPNIPSAWHQWQGQGTWLNIDANGEPYVSWFYNEYTGTLLRYPDLPDVPENTLRGGINISIQSHSAYMLRLARNDPETYAKVANPFDVNNRSFERDFWNNNPMVFEEDTFIFYDVTSRAHKLRELGKGEYRVTATDKPEIFSFIGNNTNDPNYRSYIVGFDPDRDRVMTLELADSHPYYRASYKVRQVGENTEITAQLYDKDRDFSVSAGTLVLIGVDADQVTLMI